ncbi:VOC family protein [Prosthecomicrobium sp. N25]|uniref:VOC family protein n=1 Tax=Prosthecomicrobium sp. N25 TaxID=3129254 RepID=UPI003076CED2
MWKHGTFTWNELNTRNPDAARAFYGELLGWTFDEMPMPEGPYWVARQDGAPVAGVFTMAGPAFDGIPEHWFPYVAVEDVDALAARVEAAGGTVLRPAWDVPGVGRIVIVRDCNGAAMGWMTPAPQDA